MSGRRPVADSLVLYKSRPARVVAVGDKIEIALESGATKRVRQKDVVVLHVGPLKSFSDLEPCEGDLVEAWELLAGSTTNLQELAELLFGAFSPATAWAAWEQVVDGVYFEGVPDEIRVKTPEFVARELDERAAKIAARQSWDDFAARVAEGRVLPEDGERLEEVARLARCQSQYSRTLRDLGYKESPEIAHGFLLKLGYWQASDNPYPSRFGVSLSIPDLKLPGLADGERADLTAMVAYAIDDASSPDPDDAVSFDGEKIWVHVADVAALVPPGSEPDLEARSRGSNLYLPDCTVPMLPLAVTERLGLGLQEISPALSFGFVLSPEGVPEDIEVRPSLVRVQRVSYEDANERMNTHPFDYLHEAARRFRTRRIACGSVSIDLPEVSVRVIGGEVRVKPLARTLSREMVTETMLMAGEAAARFCAAHGIPVPFATQPAPESCTVPEGMAAMYAYRNRLKPSRLSLEPAAHCGLGLERYVRTTSPLRRYSDLLVHQQVRAYLRGEGLVSAKGLETSVAMAESAGALTRKAERISNTHWKLVFLQQNPQWTGTGVLVQKEGGRGIVIVPELGLESRVRLRGEPPLDSGFRVTPREIDLPGLTCYFSLRD